MVWDGNYESIPKGTDFGSSSCDVIRSIKSETKTRFSVEHTFDETASCVCTHKLGLCTVVQMYDGAPSTNFVVGGLVFDYTNQVLYRDTGATLVAIGGLDHASLLNLTAALAHTQYLLCAGDTATDVTVPAGSSITGLDIIEGDYNAEDVMSIGIHNTTDDAPHDDETVTDIDIPFSCTKIKMVQEEFTWTPSAVDQEEEWLIGQYAFMPQFEADTVDPRAVPYGVVLCPLFNVTPPDDWVAGFTINLWPYGWQTGMIFHMKAWRIDNA